MYQIIHEQKLKAQYCFNDQRYKNDNIHLICTLQPVVSVSSASSNDHK